MRARRRLSTAGWALRRLFRDTFLGHVGFVAGDRPVVIPTAVCLDSRAGDRVLLHGSTGSGWMRTLQAGAPVCLTVTALDALVVARSAFESSFHYRSAVISGSCSPLTGADKLEALELLTERILPGRSCEVRASSQRELAATLALTLPICGWTFKSSHNWPTDPPSDVRGDAWAGVVPCLSLHGAPSPAPDLAAGIPVPPSVRRLTRGGS